MPTSHAVFDRPDTMFGVCEAIGQDFGFNPLFLRIAFAVLLIWNPVAVIAVYGVLGVGVALSRVLFPVVPRRVSRPAVAAPPSANDDAGAPDRLAA